MTGETALYLHVKIQLVRGRHKEFMAAMGEMAPVLEEAGWRLIVALTPMVGRLGAVYHVWRVPSAQGVIDALNRVRAHPDAARWHQVYAETIEDEALELVTPTSYSRTP
jgi:hypothetical protein